jgi:transcription elongation GreA/GreB family factor
LKDKTSILQQIIFALQTDLSTLQEAVKVAQESATHEENIAENKYDTLGLEASYLAHGQAKRAEEIELTLHSYEAISTERLQPHETVGLSSWVELEDQDQLRRNVWLGAEGGGVKFQIEGVDCIIVTPHSPLGAALMGRKVGDVFELNIAGNLVEYEIIDIN